MDKYIFDSNIFVGLQRQQPLDLYPSVWNKIDELMQVGTVVSSAEVLDEISVGGDELNDWAKKREEFFLPADVEVQNGVRDILSKYRGLVEGGKKCKCNSADPFVIALAKKLNYTVVTNETKNGNLGSPKIPDVCDKYNIKCINFVDFSRKMKFVF